MARRILIIQGHPDSNPAHFGYALADAYRRGAEAGGFAVQQFNVAQLDFPLLRSKEAYEHGPLPVALQAPRQALVDADHLVLIYPLWQGTTPALLKGFLEQLFRPDLVATADAGGIPRRRLRGKSARFIVTMGMPALAYRWFYRAHSLKSLKRNIFHFVGIKPVRTTLIGTIETMDAVRAHRLFSRMDKLGRGGR